MKKPTHDDYVAIFRVNGEDDEQRNLSATDFVKKLLRINGVELRSVNGPLDEVRLQAVDKALRGEHEKT